MPGEEPPQRLERARDRIDPGLVLRGHQRPQRGLEPSSGPADAGGDAPAGAGVAAPAGAGGDVPAGAGAGTAAAASTISTATGAITKNVSTSDSPITTSPDGASVAPIALRRSDSTTETFTKLVSIRTTSGRIATSAISPTSPSPSTLTGPRAGPAPGADP